MDHSFEEIRSAALDVIAGRVKTSQGAHQYDTLRMGVAETLTRRDLTDADSVAMRRPGVLSQADNELFMEVFWDLFRQGVITLGYNDANREFPFFRLTQAGRRMLETGDDAAFHDASAYVEQARRSIPDLDQTTAAALAEAMHAFRAGCLLASVTMLGAALDLVLGRAVEHLDRTAVGSEDDSDARSPVQRLTRLRRAIERQPEAVPHSIRNALEEALPGVESIFRITCGAGDGSTPDREHVYILLKSAIGQLRALTDLCEHLAAAKVLLARGRTAASV